MRDETLEDKQVAAEFAIKRGMRWKLMVAMVSTIVALVVMLTVLQVNAQRDSLKGALAMHISFLDEQMNKKALKAAGRMSGHVENLIATHRLPLAKEFLRDVVRDIEDLRYVILMRGSKSKVAIGANLDQALKQYILSGDVSSYASGQKTRMHHHFKVGGHAFMEMVVPIQVNQQQWGVLRLGFSLDELNDLLAKSQQYVDGEIKSALTQAILTSILFLIVGALMVYYFARRWTSPIQRLVHFSHELASGNFSATPHISTRTDDEIGLLVSGLEEMADSLRHSYAQLEDHSHILEDKVEQRTRQLAEARDKALAATQAKSDFLANMSHEIRTPMNAVIGMAHLALDGAVEDKQRDYLNKILKASESLLVIINDILDFSKVEAGKLSIEAVSFNLSDTLESIASVSEVAAAQKDLELCFECPPDLPALHGDAMRLGQILLNLINNAVKFTEQGQVLVRVEVLQQADDVIELAFSVTDSGIGMTAEQQQSLFQAFSQADTSITRNYGGTGLGLAICKQLVELMQGEIGVESTPGQGSCFRFRIPFAPGSSDPLALQQVDKPLLSEALQALHGARLLLVEDNEINQQVAEGLLARVGVSLMVAHNGQQAVEAVQHDAFDGILMDMQMPVMDGLEATRLIRAEQRFAELPIIAMTANAMPGDREKCLQAGMNDHVSKPVDPNQLYATLIRWIRGAQLRAAEHVAGGRTGHEHLVHDSEAADTHAFAHLPGIDSAAGLQRVGGDKQLYGSILQKFYSTQADSLQQLRRALQAGEREQVLQLLHALRGVVGNIAATDLHDVLAELESAVQSADGLIDTGLLDTAQVQLDEVLAGIAAWLKEQQQHSASHPALGSAAVEVLLERMHQLLEDYNGDAVDLMDELESAVSHADCAAHVSGLRRDLAAYDFDAALRALDVIVACCQSVNHS